MSISEAGPVFISSAVAREVFDWEEAIKALQCAYGTTPEALAIPSRTVATGSHAWLRTLPAIPPGGRYFGAKLMGMAVGAGAMAGVQYVIVLFDHQTSRIAAFLDANLITGYRTAATSAAALERISPPNASTLGVLGSGLEASMHTRAFAHVRQLSEVLVFSPTVARREDFARTLTAELQIPVRAVASPEDAAQGADIVLAAARSKNESPILFGDWLKPGATVISIGSTIPQQREVDASVIQRADLIVCDTLEEVLEETGDMIAAAQAGIQFHEKAFSLFDLMSGGLVDRLNASQVKLYKSVGCGLQDVVMAELILTKALAAKLATDLPISFDLKQ